MADGLARVTGTPGVCLVTSGPGATNLLTGIAGAHVAHSPVLALVGGVIPRSTTGATRSQDYDLVSMFKPVTKLAVQVNSPAQLASCAPRREAAGVVMSGRRGPVFVELPRDVLGAPVPPSEEPTPGSYRPTHALLPPDPDAIRRGRPAASRAPSAR